VTKDVAIVGADCRGEASFHIGTNDEVASQ